MASPPTTVLLIRHGRTRANREGIFRGRMDVPLDERGKEQAAATGRHLADRPLDAVYSSPLVRARDTARAVARPHGLAPRIEEAFDNLELGPWTGRRRAEVAEEDPENWRIWIECPEELDLPGAETLDQVAERSSRRLDELVAAHAGETLAVVAHRAVIKPLLARILRLERPWFWRFAGLFGGPFALIAYIVARELGKRE